MKQQTSFEKLEEPPSAGQRLTLVSQRSRSGCPGRAPLVPHMVLAGAGVGAGAGAVDVAGEHPLGDSRAEDCGSDACVLLVGGVGIPVSPRVVDLNGLDVGE
ncbi:hypothetical protein [Streptomyces sp. ISL-11]|uniref:hypothetical protein n=1 Tax=Streptomyces sp. ISL-11 TaxID=2819174 RepID=UPI001BE954B9|nr:hypothetical protein [Streptomyces sp. ISL-11]MBT2385613.1 hypothetical protein [Streptomyces sp. ISL-11]